MSSSNNNVEFSYNTVTFKYGRRSIGFTSENIIVKNNIFTAEHNSSIPSILWILGKTVTFANNKCTNMEIGFSIYDFIIEDNTFSGYLNTWLSYLDMYHVTNSLKIKRNNYTQVTNEVSRLMWYYETTYEDTFLNNLEIEGNNFGSITDPYITFRLGLGFSAYLKVFEINRGTTSQRPTKHYIGYKFFDETLSKPIFWTGDTTKGDNGWVDANGNNPSTVYPKVIGTPTTGNLAKFNSTNIEDAGVTPTV